MLHRLPKKWMGWDVAEDGTLSRGGMTRFPIYDKCGALATPYMTYKLIDDKTNKILATEHSDLEPLNV